MPGFKDKFSSSLGNLRDHVTSEEFTNAMADQAQSLLETAKNDLPDIVEEIQVSRAFGISGTTVVKRRVREWQFQQLASIAEEALASGAQADSQSGEAAALEVADPATENSDSGIEIEGIGAITSLDPDDPWAEMQFEDDADTSTSDPWDRISFRR